MPKILFIPLDERPCNMIYPYYIGKISGLELCMPPEKLLGRFKKPADVEAVWEWTLAHVKEASHVVISMDMLLYGGIVPSRLHHLPEEVCKMRIERLERLKEESPGIQIYAFGLITRAPARDGSGEEPDYYEDYGYRIFRYGVITDRMKAKVSSSEEEEELKRIQSQIPSPYLEDFLERRRLNYRNHIRTIELAEKGVIDYLIIPLDDCGEYGYAPAERKMLSTELAKRRLLNRVSMYPGADEIGCVLTARAVNHLSGRTPRAYVDYSSLRGKLQIPAYEDRSIGETVLYHLMASGCEEAENTGEADFVLAVNPPTPFSLRLEKELVTDDLILESERNFPAFLSRLKCCIRKGIPVGIADCAVPNGADRVLMEFLNEENLLNQLTSFGAWNTSSNTLGTVVAHMVSINTAFSMENAADGGKLWSEEFRFYRYLEDWGYMAEVRRPVTSMLASIDPSLNRLDLKDQEPVVRGLVMERLKEFHERYFPEAPYAYKISLPWNRMFEVEIKISHGED